MRLIQLKYLINNIINKSIVDYILQILKIITL